MFSLVEYGIGKMLVGISSLGDKLTGYELDSIEEVELVDEEIKEVKEEIKEEVEVEPYVKKLDYLIYLDKEFSFDEKSKGIKFYVLDKIKKYNYNYYEISGTIRDDIEHKIKIELDKNYNIKSSSCTCGNTNCKHIYALLLKFMDKEYYKDHKIYYMFKTRYLLYQFRRLYDLINEHIEVNTNEDLATKIRCYDILINNYIEREPSEYLYKEILDHFDNLKNILHKLDKDLYNELIIEVEFIDFDICAKFFKDLVNEDYIEDILLDNIVQSNM